MLVQIVHIQVLPGRREAFIDVFRRNWQGTRNEPGNLRFDLLCDPGDENSFSVYEVFEDEAALDRHRATPHYRDCIAAIEPLTQGSRSKRFLKPVLLEP